MTGPYVEVKQYTEGKAIRFTLKDYTLAGVKQAYDLSSKNVRLILRDSDGNEKIYDTVTDTTKLAKVSPETGGQVDFTPRLDDLDSNVLYNAELQVYASNFLDSLEDFTFKVLKILKKI